MTYFHIWHEAGIDAKSLSILSGYEFLLVIVRPLHAEKEVKHINR